MKVLLSPVTIAVWLSPPIIKLTNGKRSIDLLSANKILSSKGEVRRAIKGNAIKLNNNTLSDENKIIKELDFGENRILKISFGKKNHYLFKII